MNVFYAGRYDRDARMWPFLGQAPMPAVPPSDPIPSNGIPAIGIATAALAVAGIVGAMMVVSGAFSNRD